MQDSIQISKVVRFETFELNLKTGELRKGGVRIRLQEQSFQVLAALLDRPGKLVTREALRERLWPDDTFVDFDKGLNIAVSKLRQALGDSAEEPRFVETLPRRGYRFIGPVERLDSSGEIVGLPEGSAAQRTISHYRLLEKLGEGGMGVVYKALDTKLKRPVALRFLRADVMEDAEAKERFLREAQAAAALDHPNICTVFEIDEAEGQTFLAMAFVAGRTIKDKISDRPLKLEEVLGIATQTAEGLKAAHRKGIVHRDIKPANLMLTEEGQVKIMDFGLAQLAEQSRLTKTATILGTPAYMSPEQTRRKPTDRRTDVWSLGVVIYEMVTGRLPFAGERQEAVLYAIGNEDPEPITALRAGLPIELDFMVGKALAKGAADRYQHVEEMIVDLRALERRTESGGAKPSSRPVTARRWEAPARARRRRSAWAGAAAVIVLTIAGAALWNFLPTAEAPPEPFEVVPFTTYEGIESDPSFSPEGTRIAFAWNGSQEDNWDIYVKLIGPGPPLRLTTDPRQEWVPAFSPDGREIAFVRALESDKVALVVVPALGGPERVVLAEARNAKVGHLAWSPDGKYIACPYMESAGSTPALFAFSVETGKPRRLTNPPEQAFGDSKLAFSPDGRTLAFVRMSGGTGAVYFLDLDENLEPQGEPRQLIPNQWSPGRLTWTADGSEIIFSSHQQAESRLMRIAVSGGQPRPLTWIGTRAHMPAISPQGNRLAFVQNTAAQANVWRVRVASPGGQAGAPAKLISSTRADFDPQYSPDGEKIAFASDRSGSTQIWVSDADGSNARQLTHRFSFTGYPDWSPAGKKIVFVGRTEAGKDAEIYVMDAGGGVPKRLTTDSSLDREPHWSRDGQWIYFSSDRAGGGKLTPWKMPAEGGKATQVTSNEAHYPRESLDGKFLYYLRGGAYPGGSIWRMPLEGARRVWLFQGLMGILPSWRTGSISLIELTRAVKSRSGFSVSLRGRLRS